MNRTNKTLFLLFSLIIMLVITVPVFAEKGNVSYVGGAEKFIFLPGSKYSPTDLFDDFKNVMPGDKLTQRIVVKNKAKNHADIRLYMRSFGAQLDTDEFLSQLHLTVKPMQKWKPTVYDAPANETAQLTDWVYLGTIHSGENITLDVTLDVPITMGNEFQNAIGYLDWQFKIEEMPVSDDAVEGGPRVPNTGDATHLTLWISLLVISAAAIAAVLFSKRKKDQNN